jgi:hypothetical protein
MHWFLCVFICLFIINCLINTKTPYWLYLLIYNICLFVLSGTIPASQVGVLFQTWILRNSCKIVTCVYRAPWQSRTLRALWWIRYRRLHVRSDWVRTVGVSIGRHQSWRQHLSHCTRSHSLGINWWCQMVSATTRYNSPHVEITVLYYIYYRRSLYYIICITEKKFFKPRVVFFSISHFTCLARHSVSENNYFLYWK